VIAMVDAAGRTPKQALDGLLPAFVEKRGVPLVVVLNKCDLLTINQVTDLQEFYTAKYRGLAEVIDGPYPLWLPTRCSPCALCSQWCVAAGHGLSEQGSQSNPCERFDALFRTGKMRVPAGSGLACISSSGCPPSRQLGGQVSRFQRVRRPAWCLVAHG
jgi:hypothetical protein